MMTSTDISDSLKTDTDALNALMRKQQKGTVTSNQYQKIMQNASDAAKNLANNNKKITQDIAPPRRRKKFFI